MLYATQLPGWGELKFLHIERKKKMAIIPTHPAALPLRA